MCAMMLKLRRRDCGILLILQGSHGGAASVATGVVGASATIAPRLTRALKLMEKLMGKTPRKYKGARTPQSLKEVRASARRNAVQQPLRSAAKSLVANALEVIAGKKAGDAATAVSQAASALDRAAKKGAIHKNAAARRKSRLAKRVSVTTGKASDAPVAVTKKSAKPPVKKVTTRKSTRA